MENEMELSLELSIGGCYAKSESKTSLEREKGRLSEEFDNAQNDDLQKRREMQAMKRREARMKREFKKSRGMMKDKEIEGAAPAPKRERSSNASSSKVSWGPIGNGFAWDGQQPPPSSSHHRSTSHIGEYR